MPTAALRGCMLSSWTRLANAEDGNLWGSSQEPSVDIGLAKGACSNACGYNNADTLLARAAPT
jgi:hypothetical protein